MMIFILDLAAFISVLHLYETLGWWRRADYLKVHFAESWNELHHLLIMEVSVLILLFQNLNLFIFLIFRKRTFGIINFKFQLLQYF